MTISRIGRRARAALLALLCLGSARAAAAQMGDLRVLRREGDGGVMMGYTDAANALYHTVQGELVRDLDARERAVAALRTPAEWRARQREVRAALLDVLGPFPERTPLNVRVAGTSRRDGYRLEKLIYDSRPGFPVTAALFIPDGLKGPAPAILYLSGHVENGFRAPGYQWVILNLVRKGFVVLAPDPVGQGERLEYGKGEMTGLGWHAPAGVQLFLTGNSLAREMVWDGMRALDYLATRPEVDPARIGAMGRSGGGTQTAYLAAVDDRVRAAAPGNYITSLRRLWETRGPQDPEQHFIDGVARGLDHADLLVARAPKPTLLVTTTRDIFSIQGARETYEEAKRAFAALGAPEMLRKVEGDTIHASTVGNREATYAFFQEVLRNPGSPRDEAVTVLPDSALRVTRTGLVTTSLNAGTSFTLNRRDAERLRAAREAAARADAGYPAAAVRAARGLSGYRDPGQPRDALFMGRYHRVGYSIEKYILPSAAGYPIPFLLMLPDGGARHPALVYLDPRGKEAEVGGEMERLVRQGYAVAAPDLVGTGEMTMRDFQGGTDDPRAPVWLWFGSVSVGRSVVGIQAADLVSLVRHLQRRPEIEAGGVRALARGEMASVLLHAAAFEPAISAVALVDPLVSYQSLVETRLYQPRFVTGGVAGMLTAYDLPDLAASLAPRPLLVLNAVDAAGSPLDAEHAASALAAARDRYARAGDAARLRVLRTGAGAAARAAVAEWLRAAGPGAR